MRGLYVLLAILLFCSPAWADSTGRVTVQNATEADGDTAIAVALTGAAYTASMPALTLTSGRGLAVMYKSDVATGDTNLFLEQSYAKPATEGAADTNYVITHVLDNEIADGNWHIASVDTVSMPYFRFKLTGESSNPATTTVQIKVVR